MSNRLRAFGPDLVIDPVLIVAVSRDHNGWDEMAVPGIAAPCGSTVVLHNGATIHASAAATDTLLAYFGLGDASDLTASESKTPASASRGISA